MKIAIVGAGICGLYLAWNLSEKGYEVTVFEKKEKIGKKTCSGLFSQRILDFIPGSQNLIQNQIEYVVLHFPRRTLKIKFSKKFFVMSHFKLDELVANLATRAGAKIILNHSIDSIPEGFDRVIGCDGVNSIIRKNLKLASPEIRLALQSFLLKNDSSNYVETWATKSGFLWRIPRGEKTEYGIIERPRAAGKIFKEFLKRNNLQLKTINLALVPQGFIIPSNPKITLCGDSVGLTKPWSGGGVIWNLIAANILLKNFPDFLKYKKVMKRTFLPKIIFSKIAKKIVYFLGFKLPWVLPKNFKIEGDFLI